MSKVAEQSVDSRVQVYQNVLLPQLNRTTLLPIYLVCYSIVVRMVSDNPLKTIEPEAFRLGSSNLGM